jgi:hypothetical protein
MIVEVYGGLKPEGEGVPGPITAGDLRRDPLGLFEVTLKQCLVQTAAQEVRPD